MKTKHAPHAGNKSAPQNTAVGSGSRPTGKKIKIPSSMPSDAKGLGRKPPGALS
jgi:hypothetical protein